MNSKCNPLVYYANRAQRQRLGPTEQPGQEAPAAVARVSKMSGGGTQVRGVRESALSEQQSSLSGGLGQGLLGVPQGARTKTPSLAGGSNAPGPPGASRSTAMDSRDGSEGGGKKGGYVPLELSFLQHYFYSLEIILFKTS